MFSFISFHRRDEREMMLQKQMKLAKTLITHDFSMKPVIHDVTYDAPTRDDFWGNFGRSEGTFLV